MYVHGGVGVLAMLAWVVYRGEVPRWFGATVVLLGLFPLIWRLATNNRCFLQHEWLLIGPSSIASVLSLLMVFRSSERLVDWGLGTGDWRWWCPRMLLAIVIMIPTVYGVMLADPSLASFYPVWTAAQTDFGALLWALLGVGLDMLGWEFLFRGALLFGLARRGDVHLAIWLQVFPFFLLHAGKPNSELILSIFGGVLSGWFCWRARCFWPLFVLHWVQLSCVNVIGFALR